MGVNISDSCGSSRVMIRCLGGEIGAGLIRVLARLGGVRAPEVILQSGLIELEGMVEYIPHRITYCLDWEYILCTLTV